MANHLYALEEDFITPVSVTAVSEAAGREAENVLTWSRPNRLFIGTGAIASEALVFDFGSTTIVPGVFVDAYNTRSGIIVQGNATNSWGSPSYSATFDPATSVPAWGRNRIFCDLSGGSFASLGYRYMRIRPELTSTIDNSSVWKVGGVVAFSTIYTIGENFGFPFDVEVFEPVDVQPRVGAPPEVSILGEKRFFLTLSQPVASSALDADAKLILDQGLGRHVFFARNNGDTREAWVMRRVSRNALSVVGVRTRSLQNVAFEEVA